MTEIFRRWMPLLVASAFTFYLQWLLLKGYSGRYPGLARALFVACQLLSFLGVLATVNRFAFFIPATLGTWVHALSLLMTLTTLVLFLRVHLRVSPNVELGRRRVLQGLANVVAVSPALALGYGVFVERSSLTLREVDIPISNLPKDLEGLRIGQITDIHRGPFLDQRDLVHAVAMVNEGRPHLTVVTGDLISRKGDPLDECIEALGKLKAEAGVYGCMGNHERYARAEAYTQQQCGLRGIRFLRNQAEELRFGDARLSLAGVDYQPMRSPYLRRGERLLNRSAVNILLSHNPDVAERAAALGFDLMLAGHTHGGQVNVEILEEQWNVARFYTRYVSGLYRVGGKTTYVNRGVGTIGLPLRLGAPPEVTILRLRGV